MYHKDGGINGHPDGTQYTLSGELPGGPLEMPDIGGVVAQRLGTSCSYLPPYIMVPGNHEQAAMTRQGFLPSATRVFKTGGRDLSDPAWQVPNLNLLAGIDERRFGDRQDLLSNLNVGVAAPLARPVDAMQALREQAVDMLTNPGTRSAFRLADEPDAVRDRYGRGHRGQCYLLGRRLIERGVRFVTVDVREPETKTSPGGFNMNWDHHDLIYTSGSCGTIRNKAGGEGRYGIGTWQMMGSTDQAFAALITDMHERGLLAETLVCFFTEFGRTPKINKFQGRDHWAHAYSQVFAGAGVPGGQVIGRTDRQRRLRRRSAAPARRLRRHDLRKARHRPSQAALYPPKPARVFGPQRTADRAVVLRAGPSVGQDLSCRVSDPPLSPVTAGQVLPYLQGDTMTRAAIAVLIAALTSPVLADEPLLDESDPVERIVDSCKFTEGPAVDKEGNLFFSDGRNDRIMRYSTDGKLTEFRKPCGRVNGITFDREWRLVMCQSAGDGGGRKVARLEIDGSETVLAAEYNGQRLTAPNDVCVDPQGRIFFTDPAGLGVDNPQGDSSVFRIDAPGKFVKIIDNLQKPNGILVTPDGKTLYVSDRGPQKLHRYKVAEDGNVSDDTVIYDFSPDRGIDGMRLDERGNIWAAAGQEKTSGLFVVSPQGKLLLHKPMGEFSTNLCFGGLDGKTLFFTATTSVYKLRTTVAGVAWSTSK